MFQGSGTPVPPQCCCEVNLQDRGLWGRHGPASVCPSAKCPGAATLDQHLGATRAHLRGLLCTAATASLSECRCVHELLPGSAEAQVPMHSTLVFLEEPGTQWAPRVLCCSVILEHISACCPLMVFVLTAKHKQVHTSPLDLLPGCKHAPLSQPVALMVSR